MSQDLVAALAADGEIVTERLDHWAATAGDRPFFHYGEDGVTLTFAEFGRRTDAIAGNLAAQGVGKGGRVSVFCLNPLVSALVMFGAWKAGALYCPINFGYAGRLLSYQLDDTGPLLVVTEPALLPALNEVAGGLAEPPAVVVYDAPPGAHDHAAEREPAHPALREVPWAALTADAPRPRVTVAYDDPANVIYTSGTTGPAKGVVQPFRWLAQYTFNLRLPVTGADVIYNDLPMYHVGGAIANVARAAWAGCEVAVWNRFSPTDFWRRVESRGVTTAILLDVMIPWLMKAPEDPGDRRNTLNKVHMQPLPAHHAEAARRFGFDFVTAGFGQTESGAPLAVVIEETAPGEGTPPGLYRGRTHEEIAELTAAHGVPFLAGGEAGRKGLMGRPSPFVEAAVLNERDEECADEEPGHLALRPRLPALFLNEYLGKPEATVQAFRNLWFHTGDAAVRDADGLFYFVDRLGDRIRVRGENLSSFQVEDMINQHPGVRYCAVFAIRSGEGDEDDVVAYVVPDEDGGLTEDGVHAFAAATMPKYMRPRHVRIVADIPRTPTNKIEKYKLRARILGELTGGAGTAGAAGR
ncbi:MULTISPECIES: AMP-binding protein [Thermomonosporaceae]|uniref:AMP-binding protein n=1 Tax=Thermomonosporaceae TaxID=2012 RepID=UPI00255A9892|nr:MULTISPECIES: AMP-binding protein [Thermomonosporaceae]MDL4774296.1 AMP-binding protein [Actinomadura xylanilytica]